MEKKVFSIKKILLIVTLTFIVVAGTTASATALSTKPSNLIPNMHKMCSTVANHASQSQDWMSAYSQCLTMQGQIVR